MDNKIWIIIRPHYSPLGNLEKVGICGADFFINSTTFVTSHHVLNESSFFPNANYFNANIFLIDSEGKKIEITKTHTIKYAPEIDVTYVQTDDKHDYISAEENYSENDDVKNIGYPTRFTKEIFGDFKIKKQFSADGSILKIKKDYSMNANDVKISNKEVLILNYSSEEGFSGGPLLKGEKVVGIMSHLYPHNRNAIAVSIKEVKNTLVAG